jgi:hypothetical protein
MPSLAALPLRDEAPDLAIPPARMARWRDGRPLKRWRYVGLYGPQLSLCAARVRIGPLPQAFWAVWDGAALRERTVFRPGGLVLDDGRLRCGPADLRWAPEGAPVTVTSRHGDSYIWTRKQPVVAEGTVDGAAVRLRGLVDDSAGYHARHTAWSWSAGVGETADGRALAWNLVDGVHDAPAASERTIWVDGHPVEAPPARFAADLAQIAFAGDDAVLRFAEQARRARADDFKVLSSDYVQPFGVFSGALPGGLDVARGWGVMERHDVRW